MEFNLASTLGAGFIGFAVAAMFYGVTCTQTFVYFRHNVRHEPGLKLVILLCWAMDTAHMAFIAHAMYHHLVQNFANPFSNLVIVWSMSALVYVAAPLEFLVRSVFISRFWRLSGCNRPATFFLAVLNLAVLAAGLFFAWKTTQITLYTELISLEWVICSALAMHLAIDISITLFIAFILWRSLTGFGATDEMIRAILKFVINAGLVASIMSLILLITYFTAPYSFVYISFYFIFCEVLLNSLLASLNLRESLREQQLLSDAPHSGPPGLGGAGAGASAQRSQHAKRRPRSSTQQTLVAPPPPPPRGRMARVRDLVYKRRALARSDSNKPLTVHVETSMIKAVHSTGGASVLEMSPITRYGSRDSKEIGYAV